MFNRMDRLTAILIDAVLRNYSSQNLAGAARALAAGKVPIRVALRVLTRPTLRRKAEVRPLYDGTRPSL